MKISERLLEYALLLVLFPFFCFALGSLGFLAGLALTKWYAVLALLLTLVALKFRSQNWKEFGIKTLLFVLLQLAFMTIGALHTDDLCDSRIYHKPAAILMADGWNPVWEPDVTKFYERNGIDPESLKTSHLQYFPKGQWVVCGILYLATGNVDAGDYVDYAFMFALAILTYCALREWLGTSQWLAALASVTISLNPIAIMSLTNAHIDGLLGESLLMFLLASACFLKKGQKRWIPWILIPAVYGCSLKHTGPAYFGVAGLVLTIPLLWAAIRRKPGTSAPPVGLKDWLKLMIPIPFAVLILCVNPFVTNTVNHTSPFYPLHSFDRANHPVVDTVADCYTMEDFKEAGPLRRFVYSYLLGQPSRCMNTGTLDYKIHEIGKTTLGESLIELNAFAFRLSSGFCYAKNLRILGPFSACRDGFDPAALVVGAVRAAVLGLPGVGVFGGPLRLAGNSSFGDAPEMDGRSASGRLMPARFFNFFLHESANARIPSAGTAHGNHDSNPADAGFGRLRNGRESPRRDAAFPGV